jgi:hypothetical protein
MTSLFPFANQVGSNPAITNWLYRIATSVGSFVRTLGNVTVVQPVIQYGQTSSSGANGSVVVNLPASYTSTESYVCIGVMQDTDPARLSVLKNSPSQITIYWAQGRAGTHTIAWSTMDT